MMYLLIFLTLVISFVLIPRLAVVLVRSLIHKEQYKKAAKILSWMKCDEEKSRLSYLLLRVNETEAYYDWPTLVAQSPEETRLIEVLKERMTEVDLVNDLESFKD